MRLATRLRLLTALSRPPVLVLLAVYAALGLAGTGHAGDTLLAVRVLVPVATFLMFSAAVNDLADERIDRINLPDDPSRPMVSAGALRGEMTAVAAVAAVVALAGGFLLGPGPGLVVTAGLCVSAGYSLPPVRLSDRGAVAALALPACYVAVPYLLGRTATAGLPHGRDLLLLAGLYVGFIGRILLKDFRDVRGDAMFGKRTFLVRHGRVPTCRFSAACWTAGGLLLLIGAPAPTPALVGAFLVQLAVVLWLLGRLATESHPRRETLLITATAILGRGVLLALLAHESMLPLHWTSLRQGLVLGALLLLTLAQTRAMLVHGPRARLTVPALPREAASELSGAPSTR